MRFCTPRPEDWHANLCARELYTKIESQGSSASCATFAHGLLYRVDIGHHVFDFFVNATAFLRLPFSHFSHCLSETWFVKNSPNGRVKCFLRYNCGPSLRCSSLSPPC